MYIRPLGWGRNGPKSRITGRSAARVYLKWVRWIGYCPARAVSIRPVQMRNSFRPAQFVHQDGTRFPRSRQERLCTETEGNGGRRGWGVSRRCGLRWLLKQRWLKRASRYSGEDRPHFVCSSCVSYLVPCWLNNGINGASGTEDFLRDLKKGKLRCVLQFQVRRIAKTYKNNALSRWKWESSSFFPENKIYNNILNQ